MAFDFTLFQRMIEEANAIDVLDPRYRTIAEGYAWQDANRKPTTANAQTAERTAHTSRSATIRNALTRFCALVAARCARTVRRRG